MFKTILFSLIQALVVVVAIVFEGKFKKNMPLKTIKAEIKDVNYLGWMLIGGSIILGSYNSYTITKNQRENMEIKENTFFHMQNEVVDNLQKILINYNKEALLEILDSNKFTSVKLSYVFIREYSLLSKDEYVIGYLMETSEAIASVNNRIDLIIKSPKNTDPESLNIRVFFDGLETVKDYLFPIFYRVNNLQSYKDYEKIDFSEPIPQINRDSLVFIIADDFLNRPDSYKYFK